MTEPSAGLTRSAQMRPMTSCTPPAEVGTTMWIGLLGYASCAKTLPDSSGEQLAAIAPTTKSRRRIFPPLAAPDDGCLFQQIAKHDLGAVDDLGRRIDDGVGDLLRLLAGH